MNARTLRARVLLEEAHVLGLDLADLIATDTTTAHRLPTVSSYIEAIAPTFTATTAATYRPYWRLTSAHLGERRLAEVTLEDLTAVVEDAAERAKRRRPASTGRASRESCVAALRSLFRRANDAGLITANPAAALTKPRRARSRRRALDDHELGELIDAVRTTSRDPDLDLLVVHQAVPSPPPVPSLLPNRRQATVRQRGAGRSTAQVDGERVEVPANAQLGQARSRRT